MRCATGFSSRPPTSAVPAPPRSAGCSWITSTPAHSRQGGTVPTVLLDDRGYVALLSRPAQSCRAVSAPLHPPMPRNATVNAVFRDGFRDSATWASPVGGTVPETSDSRTAGGLLQTSPLRPPRHSAAGGEGVGMVGAQHPQVVCRQFLVCGGGTRRIPRQYARLPRVSRRKSADMGGEPTARPAGIRGLAGT
jgi:hypothetical protein